MRKLIAFLIFISFGTLQAHDTTVELRAGYFYPTSKSLRKIYRDGGVEGEIELSKNLNPNLQVWGNVNYFRKNGRSRGLRTKTKISIVPLSVGLKYVFIPYSRFRPYLGIGPSYTFTHIHNKTRFAKRHSNKNGLGFVVKSGIYYDLSCNFILDLFFDYYYQEIHFHSGGTHQLGGLRTGIGIGYQF